MNGGTHVRVKLRYLSEEVDRHGNVRIYFRRQGRRIRIEAPFGTPEFLAGYRAAASGMAQPRKRDSDNKPSPASLRGLIVDYYQSAAFKMLDDSTKGARRGILDGLCATPTGKGDLRGNLPFGRLEPRHIATWRDAKAETPEAANAIVKALRQVFRWATSHEVRRATVNPAKEVGYLAGNPDGFHTWTIEEVRRYEAHFPLGTKARLALDLMLYTGVRRSDAVKLGRQMERDGGASLQFTETKGRRRKPKLRELPILPQLRRSIDATPSRHLTYIVTEFSKPFTANGFGNRFRRWCDAAGLPHCSAHGLRKAGATIAADNGATEHQLMAIYGWESPKQAALYTRKANLKKLARAALHLVVPDQSPNEFVSLSTPVAASETNSDKKRREIKAR